MLKLTFTYSILFILTILSTTYTIKTCIAAQEDIIGKDLNNNGIWDHVDDFINSKYPESSDKRSALQQHARTINRWI